MDWSNPSPVLSGSLWGFGDTSDSEVALASMGLLDFGMFVSESGKLCSATGLVFVQEIGATRRVLSMSENVNFPGTRRADADVEDVPEALPTALAPASRRYS